MRRDLGDAEQSDAFDHSNVIGWVRRGAGRTTVVGGHATRIELVRCDGAIGVQNAAHEIGHALGLAHVEASENLMFWATADGSNLALTAEQLAAVAD